MEFPLENGISAAVQGRKSLQGRRSNGDARRASLISKRRQEESLLEAFEHEEEDLELGLEPVSEGEEDSIETLPDHQSPRSPIRSYPQQGKTLSEYQGFVGGFGRKGSETT